MAKRYLYILMIFILASAQGIYAAAQFQVIGFTCTEVAVGDTFSCTATIDNGGDTSATVNTITIIPDSNAWLEQSSYVQAGGSFDAGESKDITFTGLKAVKSGNSNGFGEIRMDDVSDSSSSVTSLDLNVIDVSVSVSNSISSAGQSSSFTTTAEVTAGGDINANLTFAIESGGCSIGDQDASKTINGMTHGSKQSKTWNVTMGSSGDCKFTISASATGSGTKIDSTSSTVSCSDCSTSSSSSTSSGGGGGGGALKAIDIGVLTSAITYDFGKSEKLSFVFAGGNHSVRISSLGEIEAEFVVESEPQKIKLTIGEQKNLDITEDGNDDISIKLNSINILTKKAKITITPLTIVAAEPSRPSEEAVPSKPTGEAPPGTGQVIGEEEEGALWVFLSIIVILAVVVALIISRRTLKHSKERYK